MFGKNRIAIFICLIFLFAYATLSIVRFEHYGAFGFDLGLRDQTVWEYSQFKTPITTIHFYPFKSILTDHVEPIYILTAPFYWIYNSPITLLIIEAALVCASGMAIFLLAKEKKLKMIICYVLLISYLSFYGVQQAMWFDVHSASFGAAFLAWFLYSLNKNSTKWILISLSLAILSKENIALLTLLISFVWFTHTKRKIAVYTGVLSLLYLFIIFFVYFPHLTSDGYRYANSEGLLSNIFRFSSFYDTSDKQSVLLYTSAWFGFLPLLSPLFLIPAVGDLWNYFVVASNLTAAHGLFMHYRITLAPLMVFPTIFTIARYKRLNKFYTGIYLLLCVVILQYVLHLPLSYLAKKWFWDEPQGVRNINELIKSLPSDASVVSQNNITPHISRRELIFTLWPEKKEFKSNSPCEQVTCDWFRWVGTPEYLIVDTSPTWDIRHLLANNEEYKKGLVNLEKARIITRYKQEGDAILYKVLSNPSDYNKRD